MRRVALLIVLVTFAPSARAYEERIHTLLEERALPADLAATPLVPATLDDADALRRAIWSAGAAHPDADVRRRFIARYPTEAGFDRWAFKELLGFAPEAEVYGIDRLPAAQGRVGEVMAAGARQPDEDRRNQERFAHDSARKVRIDRYGEPLPLDPAQLDMGSLHGTPSQAYAHYGLPHIQFSDDPDVLKKEPWRWAYPPTAQAFAPEFAQELTDLAVCAATVGTDGGPALGWLFLAHADHYIADVANQIHTLQAVYGFFFDAKIESYKEELRSLGGLLRSRPDFVTIGIGIIKNHHFLVEQLWSKRVFEAVAGHGRPGIAAALDAIAAGDGSLEQALDARHVGPGDEFGRAIAEEVVAASCREGGEVYDAIRDVAVRDLSRVCDRSSNRAPSCDYAEGMDPDESLRPDPDPATLAKLYRLEGAGFARAGSALRRHARLYVAELTRARGGEEARRAVFAAAAQRLVQNQLGLLEQAEQRLAGYQPRPPRVEQIDWPVPGGLLAVGAVIIGVPAWLVRRRRKRRTG
jgi:hypothetical protein